MGKPSYTRSSEGYRDDAVSLHTTPDDYTYDDAPEISGLPPSYADSEAHGSTTAVGYPPMAEPTITGAKSTYVDPRYDTDPVFLEQAIRACAQHAPSQLVQIMGTHRETTRNGDKKETRQVTDFKIVLNLQNLYMGDFYTRERSAMMLGTVENSEKTYRGTILKTRAPGSKQDIEVGTQAPSLTEWCHRYCASPRMLRTFRLNRKITGFSSRIIKERVEGLIRATNYRGHLAVTFPIEHENVDFYTSNRINEWRLKKWVCWLFYLTFLWIFTWPFLFFATKRYAVVRAIWPFSDTDSDGRRHFKTIGEDEWFEKWQVALRRLALDRFQGDANEEMMLGVIARPADPPMPGTISTGHAGVDSAMGFLTQGLQVARAVQGGGNLGRGLQGGWGYDC